MFYIIKKADGKEVRDNGLEDAKKIAQGLADESGKPVEVVTSAGGKIGVFSPTPKTDPTTVDAAPQA